METSAQYVIGKLHGMRMGAILSVISNRPLDRWGDNGGEDKACLAASEAVNILTGWDKTGEINLNIKMGKFGTFPH
jgi:uridine phosphorylase